MLILALALGAATSGSAVPEYVKSICMPFVRDGGAIDVARSRIQAAGLRPIPMDPGDHTQRFTNKRYEIQIGMDAKNQRWCNAYDLLVDTKPLFAAAKLILAQDPSFRLTESKPPVGFWRWDSPTMTVEVDETGNDFAPENRIMPGIEVSSLKGED